MIFDIVVKYYRGTLNDAMKGKGEVELTADPTANPYAPPHLITPMHLHDPKVCPHLYINPLPPHILMYKKAPYSDI